MSIKFYSNFFTPLSHYLNNFIGLLITKISNFESREVGVQQATIKCNAHPICRKVCCDFLASIVICEFYIYIPMCFIYACLHNVSSLRIDLRTTSVEEVDNEDG